MQQSRMSLEAVGILMNTMFDGGTANSSKAEPIKFGFCLKDFHGVIQRHG